MLSQSYEQKSEEKFEPIFGRANQNNYTKIEDESPLFHQLIKVILFESLITPGDFERVYLQLFGEAQLIHLEMIKNQLQICSDKFAWSQVSILDCLIEYTFKRGLKIRNQFISPLEIKHLANLAEKLDFHITVYTNNKKIAVGRVHWRPIVFYDNGPTSCNTFLTKQYLRALATNKLHDTWTPPQTDTWPILSMPPLEEKIEKSYPNFFNIVSDANPSGDSLVLEILSYLPNRDLAQVASTHKAASFVKNNNKIRWIRDFLASVEKNNSSDERRLAQVLVAKHWNLFVIAKKFRKNYLQMYNHSLPAKDKMARKTFVLKDNEVISRGPVKLSYQQNELLLCVLNNDLKSFQENRFRNLDLNFCDTFLMTPLMWASLLGYKDIQDHLKSKGAKILANNPMIISELYFVASLAMMCSRLETSYLVALHLLMQTVDWRIFSSFGFVIEFVSGMLFQCIMHNQAIDLNIFYEKINSPGMLAIVDQNEVERNGGNEAGVFKWNAPLIASISGVPSRDSKSVLEKKQPAPDTLQVMQKQIKHLANTPDQEIKKLDGSCFSYLFQYQLTTKREKRRHLKTMLDAKTLPELQAEAKKSLKNDRVMRSLFSSRTKDLINELVKDEINEAAVILLRK